MQLPLRSFRAHCQHRTQVVGLPLARTSSLVTWMPLPESFGCSCAEEAAPWLLIGKPTKKNFMCGMLSNSSHL